MPYLCYKKDVIGYKKIQDSRGRYIVTLLIPKGTPIFTIAKPWANKKCWRSVKLRALCAEVLLIEKHKSGQVVGSVAHESTWGPKTDYITGEMVYPDGFCFLSGDDHHIVCNKGIHFYAYKYVAIEHRLYRKRF